MKHQKLKDGLEALLEQSARDAEREAGASGQGRGDRSNEFTKLMRDAVKHQRLLTAVPICLSIALFALAGILLIALRDRPTAMATMFACSGLGFTLPGVMLNRSLRDLRYFELTAAMLPQLGRNARADVLLAVMRQAGAPLEWPHEHGHNSTGIDKAPKADGADG